MQLRWSEQLSVGDETIDAQHRVLIKRVGALEAALRRGDLGELARMFRYLGDYALTHFEDEERILAEVGFSDRETHSEKHALLLAQSQEIQRAFQEGGLSLGSLFQFLAHDVVAMHMLRADRVFFPLLDVRGGAGPR